MNHPYSGAAGYIYANEYDRDDISETRVYANIKSFFPYDPTPTQTPFATQTHLPSSLSPPIAGSPASRNKSLTVPSGKRNMRWNVVQTTGLSPSYDRNDGNRFNTVSGHSTWNNGTRRVSFELPTSNPDRASDPLSSFVDLREQQRQPFWLEGGRMSGVRGWRRNLQRRIHDVFQMLRGLWAREP